MLNGKPMTKEYFERSKAHIDDVWEFICDNMVGDITFAANLMLSINARFVNIILKAEINKEDSRYNKKEFIDKVKKEFVKLYEDRLNPYLNE